MANNNNNDFGQYNTMKDLDKDIEAAVKTGCKHLLAWVLAACIIIAGTLIIRNKNEKSQPKTGQIQKHIQNNTGIKNAALYGNFIKTR